MLDKGTKVTIKSLEQLIKEGYLTQTPDDSKVFINEDSSFIILDSFPFYNVVSTIHSIDQDDPAIPYFLDCGIWAPEWLLIIDQDKEVVVEDNVIEVNNEEEPKEKYINKHNGKPFGKLFCMLIDWDEKISEFSSTAFSRLLKHELRYIAKVLADHNAKIDNWEDLPKAELATQCFTKATELYEAQQKNPHF